MYINQAMVFGNLTRDPELKALPSGQSVCSFSVATNKVYADRDGKRQEAVAYHNIVCWGKVAENVAKYMKKGSSIFCQGEMNTRSWEKDGQKMYRTEITAFDVKFGPKASGGESSASSAPASSAQQASPSVLPDYPTEEYPEEEINPEDIPF